VPSRTAPICFQRDRQSAPGKQIAATTSGFGWSPADRASNTAGVLRPP